MDNKLVEIEDTNFIGIDVSKYKVDVFITNGRRRETVVNTKTPLEKFFKKIKSEGSFVVLENTGGYENMCVKVLLKLGFKVHKANTNKVKAFIQSFGNKAKTDTIDAYMLAVYGKERHENLEVYKEVSEEFESMRQLALFLIELKSNRAAQKNRLKSPGRDLIKIEIHKYIEQLSNTIEEVEKSLLEKIELDKQLKKSWI